MSRDALRDAQEQLVREKMLELALDPDQPLQDQIRTRFPGKELILETHLPPQWESVSDLAVRLVWDCSVRLVSIKPFAMYAGPLPPAAAPTPT